MHVSWIDLGSILDRSWVDPGPWAHGPMGPMGPMGPWALWAPWAPWALWALWAPWAPWALWALWALWAGPGPGPGPLPMARNFLRKLGPGKPNTFYSTCFMGVLERVFTYPGKTLRIWPLQPVWL